MMSESTRQCNPDARGGAWRHWLAGGVDFIGMFVVLGVLIALFGTLSDNFLTQTTLQTIANRIPALLVIAVGMTYVLIIAGIDLSVGSVLAFGGAVLGLVLTGGGSGSAGYPLFVGIAACLLGGLLCGLFNGAVTVAWGIPSFIVTLGMLEIARGGAYLVTDSKTHYIGAVIEPVNTPIAWLGLSPAFLVAIAVVVIGQLVLARTVFGRYLIAIGTNEEAVRLSGINPKPIKCAVFAISGMMAGLGAVFYSARLSSADPNAGVGLELSAIAAVVIGGTSLMGGRGSVINSFFGVLIIATLEAGLAQAGASEPVKRVITGTVIIVAVITDGYRQNLTARMRRRLLRGSE